MITVAVIAIIAAIALPTYSDQVRRGHRAAAQAEMLDIANRQQQYLLSNRSFTTNLSNLGYTLRSEVADRYGCVVALGGGAVPTFTITCTPTGGQASDGALTINNAGIKTPADKWD